MMARGRRVVDTYSNIFSADPLLLLPKNQSAYGDEILRNLLVYRPQATSKPHLIDLLSNESRGLLERARSSPSKPDVDLVRRYHESIRDRSELAEPDFNELQKITMVVRGELTADRGKLHAFAYKNHERAMGDLKSPEAREAFARRLKIAAIGFRVMISKLENAYLNEDLCYLPQFVDEPVPKTSESRIDESKIGRTVVRTQGVSSKWDDGIIRQIAKSLHRESDLTILPEFSLPSANSRRASIVKKIKAEISKAPADHFLFAGSRHEDRYNRGLIFRKEGKETASEWWHYKRAPARGLHENILGDFHTTVPNYQTSISFSQEGKFTIGTAICYDTYDPTTFLSLVLEAAYATRENLPKIIIVPSYNPSSDFVALLRDLSFLARCCVVYVNGLHGDAEMFICGFSVSDLADKLPSVLQTLQSMQDGLAKALRDENDEFIAEAIRSPGHQRTNKQRRDRDRMKERMESVAELLSSLKRLEASGEMSHMITVEHCDDCAGDTHTKDDRDCYRDIVYYNLTKEMIAALIEFRWGYFGNEEFLPKPFQRDELFAARDLV
jgi:hypothetical protein